MADPEAIEALYPIAYKLKFASKVSLGRDYVAPPLEGHSEAAVLAELHQAFVPANGFRAVGKHHEIYLSDVRKVAPEKQRTILRQPVAPQDHG